MGISDVLDNMYAGRTLIFGHRGASAYAPMNTLEAFELAVVQGADGIELDVHRSLDGHVVVLHDFAVDETTDGSGSVQDFTLEELKMLDAGSWFDDRFTGAKVPTLDEVFEAVGQQVYINVEIKSVSVSSEGLEEAVADCINRHNMQKRVIVSSFNPLALIRFRKVTPDVPLGYLYAPDFPTMPFDIINKLTYEANHPYHEMIDERYVASAKERGYRINTWTVNDPVRAVELCDLGVDMLITDKPDVIIDALAR